MTTKTMMYRARLLLALPLALCALSGIARPMDAVGACPLGSRLTMAEPSSGAASARGTVDSRLLAGVKQRAGRFAPWFYSEALSRNTLRLFRSPDEEILVLTRCERANCDGERAYIGLNLKSGVWGGSAYMGGRVVEMGPPIMPGAAQEMAPQEVVSALICAQNLDWGD
jgi:hypothetical protein